MASLLQRLAAILFQDKSIGVVLVFLPFLLVLLCLDSFGSVLLVFMFWVRAYMFVSKVLGWEGSFFKNTRPKPVEHGYVFSMAGGTIGEWLKLVPFF